MIGGIFMSIPKQWWQSKQIERTLAALEKNNMTPYYVESSADARALVTSLLEEGAKVTVGGSMTLFETGIIDLLKTGPYSYGDRYAEGNTPETIGQIYRDAFSADAYLTSTNALTEDGELYNVDGTGNRVAAMLFGPKKVIVVCGINKIVLDLYHAIMRTKKVAAPMNAKRLSRNTPCVERGYCTECNSPERICNEYVTIGRQGQKGRIHVIIVGEDLGY